MKMLDGMISNQAVEVDLGLVLTLVCDHIIYCPKLKFKACCPNNGRNHLNSISQTSLFILEVLKLLKTVIKQKGKLDFERE
jgi:hypothetical protein